MHINGEHVIVIWDDAVEVDKQENFCWHDIRLKIDQVW